MTDQQPAKTKSPVGRVLWWILVIACCIWAALELAKGEMIAASAFLAAAVAAMPPTRAWLKRISGGRLPGWATAALPFALWAIAAGNAGPPTLPPVASGLEAPTRQAPVDVVANIVRFQGAYIGASDPCKSAFQAIADASQARVRQLQQMYELATIAQRQCRASREVIGRIDLPAGLSMEEKQPFQQARKDCEYAYFLAEQTADKLREALDDGLRPSKVAAYREFARDAVAGRASCEASIAAAAEAAVLVHRNDTVPVPRDATKQ